MTNDVIVAVVEWEEAVGPNGDDGGGEAAVVKRTKVRFPSSTVSSIRDLQSQVLETINNNNSADKDQNAAAAAVEQAPLQHPSLLIYDADHGDYRPLSPLTTATVNDIVKRHGTRWRLQVRQQREASSLLAIQGRHFGVGRNGDNSSDGSFHIPGTDIVLHIAESHNQPNTTAFTVWDGSLLLAHYLALLAVSDDDDSFTWDRRTPVVLELGAGCGICGLTAAALGAAKVVLTDLPNALPWAQVERNRHAWQSASSRTSVSCHGLDWTRVEANNGDISCSSSELDFVDRSTSLVLIADCVWTMELLPPLLTTIQALLQLLLGQRQRRQQERESSLLPQPPRVVTFLISYQQRGATTHEAFHQGLLQLFGDDGGVQDIDVERLGIQRPNPQLFLYKCRR